LVLTKASSLELEVTYSDFISILLTVVTIVLTLASLGLGYLAFRSLKELKDESRVAVRKEIQRYRTEMELEIANFKRQVWGGDREYRDLERNFDPASEEER